MRYYDALALLLYGIAGVAWWYLRNDIPAVLTGAMLGYGHALLTRASDRAGQKMGGPTA